MIPSFFWMRARKSFAFVRDAGGFFEVLRVEGHFKIVEIENGELDVVELPPGVGGEGEVDGVAMTAAGEDKNVFHDDRMRV